MIHTVVVPCRAFSHFGISLGNRPGWDLTPSLPPSSQTGGIQGDEKWEKWPIYSNQVVLRLFIVVDLSLLLPPFSIFGIFISRIVKIWVSWSSIEKECKKKKNEDIQILVKYFAIFHFRRVSFISFSVLVGFLFVVLLKYESARFSTQKGYKKEKNKEFFFFNFEFLSQFFVSCIRYFILLLRFFIFINSFLYLMKKHGSMMAYH